MLSKKNRGAVVSSAAILLIPQGLLIYRCHIYTTLRTTKAFKNSYAALLCSLLSSPVEPCFTFREPLHRP
jgi:hypothetical protein